MASELSAIFAQMEVPCAVKEDASKGKHVVALTPLRGNTVLFEEIPIVSWPFVFSRPCGSFCDWCLASIVDASKRRKCCSNNNNNNNNNDNIADDANKSTTGDNNCCPAVFCSAECEARARNNHAFLCGAPFAAIRKFDKECAMKRCTDSSKNNKNDDDDDDQEDAAGKRTMQPCPDAVDDSLPITCEAVARSVASVAVRYAALTHQNPNVPASELFPHAAKMFNRLVACPDDADFDEIDVAAWFATIRQAMRPRLKEILQSDDVCDALLSKQTLTTMLGQLNLNAQALNLPVEDKTQEHNQDGGTEKKKMIRPSVGAGVFALQACLNHSCAPNAFVVFGDNHEISVKLRRGVSEGEEITITYIPELFLKLENYEARRARLQNYFFKCVCERCLAEEKEDLEKKSKQSKESAEDAAAE